MAGNAVILKPDQQGSFTALWAVELMHEAGLPPDVLAAVTGEGPRVGPWLAPRVDFVMFTGSTRTGRLVAAQAAERLIPCSLELGGKNPMVVLADADIEKAAQGAVRGAFVGAGQACIAIERIFVHQSVYERFLARMVELTRGLKLGTALDYSIDMGSLVSGRQLATVEEHIRDAVEHGAEVITGGQRRPDIGPFFFEPTILAGVREGMKVFAEETFGPVVAVYGFDTEEEALTRANATPYGLNASVWTRNTRRGGALARRIRAGSVNVNEAYAAVWASVEAPVGGMKESGLGRRHGEEGILKFTQTQTVAVQRLVPAAPPPFMSAGTHARWLVRLLRLVRHTRFLGY
jgi:acyl-CoA reductase-like NAD-dependent aldehyde dehydrogenase